MFLQKLDISANLQKMNEDLQETVKKVDWGVENQIGLTHRKGSTDPWKDCIGSLWNKETNKRIINEEEFTEINLEAPSYTIERLKELSFAENINIGRVRYMRLLPKTGLSVHKDSTIRYHFALDTNEHSYIYHTSRIPGQIKTLGYHIPNDGHFYKVNTQIEHYVYNGGNSPRIHIVICPIDKK
jgi:hypothetical protein